MTVPVIPADQRSSSEAEMSKGSVKRNLPACVQCSVKGCLCSSFQSWLYIQPSDSAALTCPHRPMPVLSFLCWPVLLAAHIQTWTWKRRQCFTIIWENKHRQTWSQTLHIQNQKTSVVWTSAESMKMWIVRPGKKLKNIDQRVEKNKFVRSNGSLCFFNVFFFYFWILLWSLAHRIHLSLDVLLKIFFLGVPVVTQG